MRLAQPLKKTFITHFCVIGALSVGITAGLLSFLSLPVMVSFTVALLLSLLIATVGANMLTAQLIQPITRMQHIIKALDNSELVDITPFTQQNELGELGRKLTAMASRNTAVEEANKDALTNLANRRYLMQRLEDMVDGKKAVSLMFIDLDKFKPINDTHGHDVGDEALKKMAELLSTCVRDNDILARIGGDEFVIAFNGLDMQDVLETRAKRVIELISAPFWVGDIRLKMGGSVGIAISPKDAETAEELLTAADEAMYAVKKSGRNNFKFYS